MKTINLINTLGLALLISSCSSANQLSKSEEDADFRDENGDPYPDYGFAKTGKIWFRNIKIKEL